jgi:hypothetical protein
MYLMMMGVLLDTVPVWLRMSFIKISLSKVMLK